jgi:hypothetical protein
LAIGQPEPDFAAFTRGEESSVGREGKVQSCASFPLEGVEELTIGSAPKFYRAVIATGGQDASVGGEGNVMNSAWGLSLANNFRVSR